MSELAAVTYASIALTQDLPLGRIAEGHTSGQLPLAQLHTPEWFAAAAEEHASLLDTAPELQVMDDSRDRSGARLDLVGIYGLKEPLEAPSVPATQKAIDKNEGARLGLLRELEGLDD